VNVADLLFEHMKIIQQPFCCRRDGVLLTDCLGNCFIGITQHPAILAHSRNQFVTFLSATDFLRMRQTYRMLFQSFSTEQLEANGRFLGPRMLDSTKVPSFSLLGHDLILRVAVKIKQVLTGAGFMRV
jgi:hypothetical protein